MSRIAVLSVVVLMLAIEVWAVGKKPNAQRSTDYGAVIEGNTAFALNLYAKLKDERGNLFVSPYSISTALAMTYAGAAGETEAQMAKALRFTLPQNRLHPAMGEMVKDLNKAGKANGFQLVTANALWPQKDFPFLKTFINVVQSNYEAGLEPVNYVNAAEEARKTINKWVEDKTNDKIKDLIGPGVLSTMTRLVLTNAIYFKAAWETHFDKGPTKDKPFTLPDGTKVDVPTMHNTESFSYMENDQLQILDLAYVGRRVSMAILLPRQTDGLSALEKSLNAKTLKVWLSDLHREQVSVALPKFKFTYSIELNKALVAMGMPYAFNVEKPADFSKMTGTAGLYIDKVIHKAFVDVNEEGTEAAAATAVVMAGGAAVMPDQLKSFVADHPFLFLIRDLQTGSILFIGRVANPAAGD